MRTSWMIVLAAFLSLSAQAFDGEETRILSGKPDYERDVDESFPIEPGARIEIDHSMGSLEIMAWEKDQVRVEARIEVKGDDARKFGDKIEIDVHPEGKTFEIETDYPGGKWEDLSFGVAVRIHVPAAHAVVAENEFGNITLSGTRGGARIEVRSGKLEVSDVHGEKVLSSAFGDVRLRDSRGKTKIEASCGDITVENLQEGDLDLDSKFGSIKVSNVKGDSVLESCNGDMKISNIDGAVKLQSSFGKIVLIEVTKGAKVKSSSGDVEISKARGTVDVDVVFGNTKITDLHGNCKIESKNGAVSLKNVQGDVDVENTFGSINMNYVSGNIEIEGRNGSISLDGIRCYRGKGKEKKPNRINCSNSMGLIEITLPDPPNCRMKASTALGRVKIKCDIDPSHREKGLTAESCVFELGTGKAEIKVENKNGDIVIRKEKKKKKEDEEKNGI